MSTPIRWLHLSDFHTGKDDYGQERLFKWIIDHVKQRVLKGNAPDLLFLSGDIANRGLEAEYSDFAENLYLPLVDILGSEIVGRTFIVPGNHDVDRKQARAAFRYDLLNAVPEFFDPTPSGLTERAQYFPRFHAFIENDLSAAGGAWLRSREGTYTARLDLRGQTVGVVCINTAWLSGSDKDRNQLRIGKPLLESALDNIRDCDLRFVVGHHPIDWMVDDEARMLRALLGRAGVLYLHGHLHRNEGSSIEGGGGQYLALQVGAAFQAREDELWVNRIVWGEVDTESSMLYLEPLRWSRDQQAWVGDTDAFPPERRTPIRPDYYGFALPGKKAVLAEPKPDDTQSLGAIVRSVRGWTLIDQDFIDRERGELSEPDTLAFFDGRVPGWKEALAPEIPHRAIVRSLVDRLVRARGEVRNTVILVKGPGGEGKSTAIRQTIAALVEGDHNWHVLWHNHPEQPFPSDWIPPTTDGQWIIASDDADLIANNLFATVRELRGAERRDVHFLLCCRDTDWIAAHADALEWHLYADYEEVPLRGLSAEDAEQIVAAWAQLGLRGLGKLAGLEPQVAATRLMEAAQTESADRQEGAFLGAMLRTRFGEDLKQHVTALLRRLKERPGVGTAETLLEAFAYLAVPHAENVLTVSKPILAEALGCKLNEVKPKVLGPLGEEAAAAMHGQYVLTRHRAIAEAAVAVMEDSFHVDVTEVLAELVSSAIRARQHSYLPNVVDWNSLPSRMFDLGRVEVAIRLAQSQFDTAPDNPHYLVNYARLLREGGVPEQSAEIFRNHLTGFHNRPFYSEWAAAEGNLGNYAVDALLCGTALADGTERRPVDHVPAALYLNAASVAFRELYSRSAGQSFAGACGAAAQLGLTIVRDPTTRDYLLRSKQMARTAGIEDVSSSTALARLIDGFRQAWLIREVELPVWLKSMDERSFSELSQLLKVGE